MRRTQRNRHRECTTLTQRALHAHLAAMEPDQFLNEGQANPCAFERPAMSPLDAMKALEYPVAVLLGNPHSRIADLQLDGAIDRFQHDRHGAIEGELERIGQEIRDHLLPHVAVDVHWFADGWAFHRKL